MSQIYTDADGLVHFKDDTRETIVKSGLSGVAATVLAVTIWSPAGLGGMIGTSIAADHVPDSAATADAVAGLAAYPVPLTSAELVDIRARLDDSEEILDASRTLTDGDIRNIRSIAARGMPRNPGPSDEIIAPRLAQAPAPVAPMRVAEAHQSPISIDPVSEQATVLPVSAPVQEQTADAATVDTAFAGGGEDYAQRDSHMELAELLLAR